MILDVDRLSFAYAGHAPLLRDITFQLDGGTVMTILGPNGAGKSTLLNCLFGLLHPTGGAIRYHGRELQTMEPRDVAQIVAYVPQAHVPVYAYTVRDFVVMGRAPRLRMYQRPSGADYAHVDGVLEELGILHLADTVYTEISGGERQLATIARAIVQEPEIVVLDEPTSHLDYGNQLRMVRLARRLADRGFGVIMTTHTPDHALLLNDRIGVLDRGGHLTVGDAAEIVNEKLLSELYRSTIRIVYIKEAQRRVCVATEW